MSDTTPTPSFIVSATYRLPLDHVEAYKALASRMAKEAKKREGCVFLSAAQDVQDPSTFHLIEGWLSQEALNAHLASEEFQAILKDALQLPIVERFGTIFFVSGAQELDMPS